VLNCSRDVQAQPSRREVTEPSNFRFLNDCCPDLSLSRPEGRLPTTKPMLQAIWQRLAPAICLLIGLRL